MITMIVVLLVIIPFLLFGDELETWVVVFAEDTETLWLGIVGAAFLAIDVLLPIPSSILAVLMGARLGLVAGAIAISGGLTLGSCFGYLLGRVSTRLTGQTKAQADRYAHLSNFRFGFLSIALFRPFPVLAETSSILAGHYRMQFGAYFLVSLFSNTALGVTYALIGSALSPRFAFTVGVILVALAIIVCAKIFFGSVRALFVTSPD